MENHSNSITLCVGENKNYLEKYLNDYMNRINVIYIDPPYNTGGNVFQYNDKRDTAYWHDFMVERLRIAKKYLAPDGVIMVSIDDHEHHNLRTILDSVFGAENFVSNIVWMSGGNSHAKFDRGGLDYIVVYAKNKKQAPDWWEPKNNVQEIFDFVNILKNRGLSTKVAEIELRKFFKNNSRKFPAGLASYNHIDNDWEIYTTASIVNSLDRPSLKYDIVDPETGRVYHHPDKGWTISKDYFQKLYDSGHIVFSGNRPRKKCFLKDFLKQKPSPIINESRSKAYYELKKIIGENTYRYTKNVSVLKKWINIVTGKNKRAIVLDFFAGSGSTGQAVAELNAEDNGMREVVLMTNNENNIADDITIPRLENILSGHWVSGDVVPLPGVLTVDRTFCEQC